MLFSAEEEGSSRQWLWHYDTQHAFCRRRKEREEEKEKREEGQAGWGGAWARRGGAWDRGQSIILNKPSVVVCCFGVFLVVNGWPLTSLFCYEPHDLKRLFQFAVKIFLNLTVCVKTKWSVWHYVCAAGLWKCQEEEKEEETERRGCIWVTPSTLPLFECKAFWELNNGLHDCRDVFFFIQVLI